MNPTNVVSIPVITALVQLAKGLGLPNRYAALTAVLLSVALTVATYYATGPTDTANLWQATLSGLLQGLAAAGLYSATRALANPAHNQATGTIPDR